MQFREYLDRRGIMNKDAAVALGVDQSTLSLALNGQKPPSLSLMMRVFFYTSGMVGFFDWVETCKLVLQEELGGDIILEKQFVLDVRRRGALQNLPLMNRQGRPKKKVS